jgi:hypothetical protein
MDSHSEVGNEIYLTKEIIWVIVIRRREQRTYYTARSAHKVMNKD